MWFLAGVVVIVVEGERDGHGVAGLLLSATTPHLYLTTSSALLRGSYC